MNSDNIDPFYIGRCDAEEGVYLLQAALILGTIHAVVTLKEFYSTIKTTKDPKDFPLMRNSQIRSRGLPFFPPALPHGTETTLGIKKPIITSKTAQIIN